MKNFKKIIAVLLTALMVMGMATAVFAEGTTYTITIKNDAENHTYEAYQIFAGDLSGTTLSNVVWGSGVTEAGQAALGNAAAKAETLKNESDAKAFAKEVAPYLTTPAGSTNTSTEGKYTISGLAAGYYLVKDQTGSLEDDDDSYTSFILQVVKDVNVEPKSAKPTVDKQVWDEIADSENPAGDGWGETADHAINERFQFKLIATLPVDKDFAAYETYKLVFTDTMSAGVTFESIASVKVGNKDIPTDGYTCTAANGQAGGSWTLTINDLKKHVDDLSAGAVVTVIYNAHLNEAAGIGNVDTNKNTVGLQYSNNPNASGEGHTELGKTPEDTVWVFTYKMENTKYSEEVNEENVLAGAGFRLYTDADCKEEVALIYEETLTAYRPVKGNEVGVEMISADTTGKFDIVGLDAGTYYLKETTTPDGYNTCAVITVTIGTADQKHYEINAGTSAETQIKLSSDGTVAAINDVVNMSGTTLPSTGGIGTTIFYVVGSILVVGAAVLLITKKRMGKN